MRYFQIHGVICPKSKNYDQTCKLKLFTEKYYKGKLLPILLDSKHISGEEVKSLKVIGHCVKSQTLPPSAPFKLLF